MSFLSVLVTGAAFAHPFAICLITVSCIVMLDLTRADAGQLRLSTERLDLCRLVDEAVRQCGPRFEESGIRMEVQKEVRSVFC